SQREGLHPALPPAQELPPLQGPSSALHECGNPVHPPPGPGAARRGRGTRSRHAGADRVMPPLDYLIVAPHPDDAELGVGGTILLLKAQGASVGVLDLTDGEPTPHASPEIRRRETAAASTILGLSWRGNLGLVNRSLEADLDARARLAGLLRQVRPR